jgi:hypothetical protein
MAVSRINEAGLNVNQYGNRNLIINGAMQVAQRSTSVASVSDGSNEGYQSLDRFALYYSNSAGGVCTISQDTTVPSGYGFSNSYKVDVTTADTSISSTHVIFIQHSLEAREVRNSGWNYTSSSSNITLSFWARSTKAGTYNVLFRAIDVGQKYYVAEYTLVADTWKKVTVTVPGDSSLVFNNDTDSGLTIRWNLQCGSDRDNASTDAWLAVDSGNQGTSNQVNFFDSTSNDFYLTGVQLEVGDTATDFEHRTFGDELARCMRYYEQMNGSLTCVYGVGYNESTSIAKGSIPFLVQKRVAPTVSVSAVADFCNVSTGSSAVASGLTFSSNVLMNTRYTCTSSNTTLVDGGASILSRFANDAIIKVDSEL